MSKLEREGGHAVVLGLFFHILGIMDQFAYINNLEGVLLHYSNRENAIVMVFST